MTIVRMVARKSSLFPIHERVFYPVAPIGLPVQPDAESSVKAMCDQLPEVDRHFFVLDLAVDALSSCSPLLGAAVVGRYIRAQRWYSGETEGDFVFTVLTDLR